ELKAAVGGEVLELTTINPHLLRDQITKANVGTAHVVDDQTIRIETLSGGVPGARLLVQLIEAFPGAIISIRVGMPTLEDVFIHCTGERYSVNAVEGKVA